MRLLTLLIPAVMRRAQGLPVGSTPEQRLVSTMGHDVVHHRGHCDSPLSCAPHTQRVLTQENLSRLLPLVAVAALGAGHALSAPAACCHGGHTPGIQHLQLGLEGLELSHVAS